MRLRVVWGLGVTMASFSPTIWLSSVDLPTLGRPRMATVPEEDPGAMEGLLYSVVVVLSRKHACLPPNRGFDPHGGGLAAGAGCGGRAGAQSDPGRRDRHPRWRDAGCARPAQDARVTAGTGRAARGHGGWPPLGRAAGADPRH